MHALRLPARRLVLRLRDLPRHSGALAKVVNVGLVTSTVREAHVDPTFEPLLEVRQERLKRLLSGSLCTRDKDPALFALVIDKINQISISEAVLLHHRTFSFGTDHAADAIDRRVIAAALPRLCVACLTPLHARHSRHAPVACETYSGPRVTRHPFDCVERQVRESLIEVE